MSQPHQTSNQEAYKSGHPPQLNGPSYQSTAEMTKHCGAWAESAGQLAHDGSSGYPRELEIQHTPGEISGKDIAHGTGISGDKDPQKTRADGREK